MNPKRSFSKKEMRIHSESAFFLGSQKYLLGGQSVNVVPMPNQQDTSQHDHDFYELVVVTGGKGNHRSEDGEFSLSAGDVFLIPPKKKHGYESVKNLSLYNLIYLPERLEKLNCDAAELPGWFMLFTAEPVFRKRSGFTDHLRLEPSALAETITRIEKLSAEISGKSPGWRLASTALFYDLLVFLCRSSHLPPVESASPAAAMARVLSRLESAYRDNHEIKTLAKEVGISERTLLRTFKQLTGLSPLQYLLEVRLKHSATLLEETDLSVTQVAMHSGFSESNYFARSFKQRYAISPKVYRDKKRKIV